MKTFFTALAVLAVILNVISYMAFDGFDWRHIVLAASGAMAFAAFLAVAIPVEPE